MGTRQMSNSAFIKAVRDKYKWGFNPIETFVHMGAPLKIECTQCLSVKHVLPYDLLNSEVSCSSCSAKGRKSNAMFLRDLEEVTGGSFKALGRYINSSVRIPFLHVDCGRVSKIYPSRFLGNPTCLHCRKEEYLGGSYGEKAVADVLDSLSIEYTREHSFEYLGRKRFDFYIPSLNIAIEYDGEQHYKSIDAWGGEEYLESVRQSDALKNDFCDYMGIDLLRVPYWEFDNIHEIVTNFIDTVKLMRSISASGSEMSKCR